MLPGHGRFSSTQLALKGIYKQQQKNPNMKCDVTATKGLVRLEK